MSWEGFVAGAAMTGAFVAGVAGYIKDQMVTWIFIALGGTLLVWMLRLHLDPKLRHFDLTKLVSQVNGEPDGEKMRMWLTYFAGLYAFFYMLAHRPADFVSYATIFLGASLTHLVANRMTMHAPQPPVQRPPT